MAHTNDGCTCIGCTLNMGMRLVQLLRYPVVIKTAEQLGAALDCMTREDVERLIPIAEGHAAEFNRLAASCRAALAEPCLGDDDDDDDEDDGDDDEDDEDGSPNIDRKVN